MDPNAIRTKDCWKNFDDVYYGIYTTTVDSIPHPTSGVLRVKPAIHTVSIRYAAMLQVLLTGVAGNTDFSMRFPQPRKIPAYSSVLVSVESTGIQSMYKSIATTDIRIYYV
jgi:hypothetical protein